MNGKYFSISFFACFCFLQLSPNPLKGQPKEESEQIVVRLATENQLIPLYLTKFSDNNSGLTQKHLQQLENVLQFDLNHNGMTCTIARSGEKDKIVNKFSSDDAGDPKTLRSLNVFYVIKASAGSDKKLSATLFAVNGDSIKQTSSAPLSGSLGEDRRKIHQLADAIHKALFDANGIASTHILYSVRKKAPEANRWNSEIWEADYDGENARRVVNDAGYNISPVYVPPKPGHHCSGFFYVGYQAAQPKIYVASLKEGVGRRLTYLRGNQLMPAIATKRNQVAFISDVAGNPDLFLQAFNPETGAINKPHQIFAARKSTQGSPAFSPDGTQLAFVSNKDGSPRIYVIDVPAPNTPLKDVHAELVTKHSVESSAPAWSPDGAKLAYCAMTNGVRQIWVYNFNTREERQLTQGPGNKENPSWAPNSLNLVYNRSQGDEISELHLINLNQPNATKITSGPGEKRFPNWEPLP